MNHDVTFHARVEPWGPFSPPRAALVAACSCGWSHAFIPNVGRERIILEIGLEHVVQATAETPDEVAVA